jgi:hypothetical protein
MNDIYMRMASRWLMFIGVLGAAGCATIPAKDSAAIHTAAVELESRTLTALTSIETEAAATDIRRVIASDELLLSESSFIHAINPKSKAAILQQLRFISDYTRAINSVGAREYKGKFAAAVVDAKKQMDTSIASINELADFATADQLKDMKSGATTLASAVAAIGEAAIDARIQSKTRDIVAATDAALSAYLGALADIFAPPGKTEDSGPDTKRGLAGVLANESQMRKQTIMTEYKKLGSAPADPAQRQEWLAQREKLAKEFAAALRGGELSVSLAASLRDACLSLRKAHTAIATHQSSGALEDLDAAVARVRYLADVFNETKSALEK